MATQHDRSRYHAITDQLLDLNESHTIGSANMRLTAKKRVVVPPTALQPTARRPDTIDNGDGTRSAPPSATFDAGEDVLVADQLDKELGRESNPFQVLEYTFDAEPLIAWQRNTIEVGTTPSPILSLIHT